MLWIKYISLMICSLIFLLFGIYVLAVAYQLGDPFAFVLTFFASNLIILISAVMLLSFVLKLMRERRSGHPLIDQSISDNES